ncbi:GntR family transcriptional regulator [Aquibium sp. ELW1220]|uniref:GntR family transcriptional regulator n=1 Tax=Aquibium sp. ELW1220 TaxID=2976766 RepID=UPI0025AF7C48|nr:GntR family transcriptional regulator [Aquibium sp. ELW1220]
MMETIRSLGESGADLRAPAVEEGARRRFDRIYDTLRMRICLLEYQPLERLREEDLAAEFKVSRTPIRRVLVKLEAEGLLRSVHGVGTFVTDIDIRGLEQVYQLRVELAELIGRLAPVKPDATRLQAFRDALARCEVLVVTPEPRDFSRLNIDFFHLLNGLTENGPLREISERLYFQTTRIWLKTVSTLNRFSLVLHEEIRTFHREVSDIVAAVEIGDLQSVGHIRRAHIAMSFARLRAYSAGRGTGEDVPS